MFLPLIFSLQGARDKNNGAQRPGLRLRVLSWLVTAWMLLTASAIPPREAARLRVFVEQHTDHPYTPVYIVFRGQLLDERPEGFAADYDGVFRLEDVLSIQANVPDDCNGF